MQINDTDEIKAVIDLRIKKKKIQEKNERTKKETLDDAWKEVLKFVEEGKTPKYIVRGVFYSEVKVAKTTFRCNTCSANDEYQIFFKIFASCTHHNFCKKCILLNCHLFYEEEFKAMFEN